MFIHRTTDGRPYIVREIQPQDREQLSAGLAKMSPSTRYFRFHTDRTTFTPEELDFLVKCDGHNHIAYVCHEMNDDGTEGEGVGVTRFYRDADNPQIGEVAVVVIDDWQGAGIGTVLLDTLAEHCRKIGAKEWRAKMVPDNDRAVHLFEHVGPIIKRDWEDRSVVLHIDITENSFGPRHPIDRQI